MKCKQCGAECPDNAKFCSHCGTKLPEPQPPIIEPEIMVSPSAPIEEKSDGTKTEVISPAAPQRKPKPQAPPSKPTPAKPAKAAKAGKPFPVWCWIMAGVGVTALMFINYIIISYFVYEYDFTTYSIGTWSSCRDILGIFKGGSYYSSAYYKYTEHLTAALIITFVFFLTPAVLSVLLYLKKRKKK